MVSIILALLLRGAFVLAVIGVTLTLHALHESEVFFIDGGEPVPVREIGAITSLVVIVIAMASPSPSSTASIPLQC